MAWNAVVTIRRRFPRAIQLLRQYGVVRKTGFYNVVTLEVPDVRALLAQLAQCEREEPEILELVAHVMPVTERFSFEAPEELTERARQIALAWAPALAGKAFHVRMHRRGLKGRVHSVDEERLLDEAILAALAERGTPGRIDFDDPDAVVVLETIGNEAGMALWSRDDLERYPLLRGSLGLRRA